MYSVSVEKQNLFWLSATVHQVSVYLLILFRCRDMPSSLAVAEGPLVKNTVHCKEVCERVRDVQEARRLLLPVAGQRHALLLPPEMYASN